MGNPEEFLAPLLAARPHLFSTATVAVRAVDAQQMRDLIQAVERLAALPQYQQVVLSWAPAVARHETANPGAFFGYDFHLTPAGPKLIEINTNAGGGVLAAWQARRPDVLAEFVTMFRQEAGGALASMAIIDEQPESQYLYPEFLLFQHLLAEQGTNDTAPFTADTANLKLRGAGPADESSQSKSLKINAMIGAPGDLQYHDGKLWLAGQALGLVYNRLTDFALAQPESAALRQAWLDDAVVVSPHPRAHALFADKRNLVVLSDDALLAEWGVDAATRAVLAAVVPRTERVERARADDFWARRRELFFKPATGYGSKAAYRGDKMTRRVFDEVLAGDYVAQALVPPSTVKVGASNANSEATELKADFRCYAYAGHLQLMAARLWQGQTTNFRTPGGGFAKVEVI